MGYGNAEAQALGGPDRRTAVFGRCVAGRRLRMDWSPEDSGHCGRLRYAVSDALQYDPGADRLLDPNPECGAEQTGGTPSMPATIFINEVFPQPETPNNTVISSSFKYKLS